MAEKHDYQKEILSRAKILQRQFKGRVHEVVTSAAYDFASSTADACTKRVSLNRRSFSRWADENIDQLLTSRFLGIPIMLLLLIVVFWLSIQGANVPSAFIAGLLMEEGGLTEWRLPKHRSFYDTPFMKDCCFFSPFYHPGRSGLPAPGGLQSGSPLSPFRCSWKAGFDHGHGPGMQCRRHHYLPDY